MLLLVRFSDQILEPESREIREWLHIEEGELVKVSHLKSRVIDQVKKELDAKSRISFKAELFKTGRKIQGWKFKVIDNKPKSERRKERSVCRRPPS